MDLLAEIVIQHTKMETSSRLGEDTSPTQFLAFDRQHSFDRDETFDGPCAGSASAI